MDTLSSVMEWDISMEENSKAIQEDRVQRKYKEEFKMGKTLVAYDFTGKTVVVFATSGGSGLGDSYKNLQVLAPGAKVINGERFSGNVSEERLRMWVEGLK